MNEFEEHLQSNEQYKELEIPTPFDYPDNIKVRVNSLCILCILKI